MPLLEIEDFRTYYTSIYGEYKSVDGVSLTVDENEIFGIAGESGCGKSTLVDGVLKLVKPPGYVKSGKVVFDGVTITDLDEEEFRKIRWKELSYIPQGAMNSLNPVLRVDEQMVDAIRAHGEVSEEEARNTASSSLEYVGLPQEVLRMYPHELSGGMKQRVIIATAMTLRPKLVFADEPVTALDVVMQRLTLESLAEFKDKFGATVVLVAHDMAVHAQIDDRLAIMYAGKIVEIGPVYGVFGDPLHPYTKGLMSAIPSLERRHIKSIPGMAPSPLNWPPGCGFHPRCDLAMDICSREVPPLQEVKPGRFVACYLFT